jgi:iron-sulfur cluster protein
MTRSFEGSPPFPQAAETSLADPQLRANLAGATRTIRAKRDRVVGELDTWEDLRLAGEAIKTAALGGLDGLLGELERNVTAAGGTVHWARDGAEANRIVADLVAATGETEVVKVKSMTTGETGINQALEAIGVTAYETDLAELIVQLGDDLPSHIVVPAIHRSRTQIRETFVEHMGEWGRPAPADLTDDPALLAGAARVHLRERFLRAQVGISGANFLVADTGAAVVVESEGNGRMCLTLPRTLITVAGIDKVIPSWEDLDVFLQVLPRSATGERMNPYTSIWTGVTAGDGPEEFHLVLVDNGRSRALADTVGRQALRCIRCAACLNVCPVYERVGGHAYGSIYPGPIGAVLTPQLDHVAGDEVATSLPYASTLCGACFDACPVRIDIPRLLVHLRGEVVDNKRGLVPSDQEGLTMAAAAWALGRPGRVAVLARLGTVASRTLSLPGLRRWKRDGGARLRLPGFAAGWSRTRTVPLPSAPSFADWWAAERGSATPPAGPAAPRPQKVRSVRAALARRTGRRPAPVPNAAGLTPASDPGPSSAGSARDDILKRIAQALGDERPSPTIPRGYRRSAGARPADPVDLFAARVGDYQATITRIDPDNLPATIAAILRDAGAETVAVPADLPREWVAAVTATVRRDTPPIPVADLDRTDAVVTAAAVAIAETGTVVLDAGPGQGRRALTLVPDHHIVVVRTDQVVPGVPDAIPRLSPGRPQTWVSGPSATSDIELNRVEGVHGPRRLDVIVVAGGQVAKEISP